MSCAITSPRRAAYLKRYAASIGWLYPGKEIGAVSRGDVAIFFRKRTPPFEPAVHWVFVEDIDATPFMKGLPDDRCQCPHWGYVVSGKLTFRYADREEVFEAGDAFYTPPGHVPVKHEPGTEVVFFSPAEELRKTETVMMKNMQAMQAG